MGAPASTSGTPTGTRWRSLPPACGRTTEACDKPWGVIRLLAAVALLLLPSLARGEEPPWDQAQSQQCSLAISTAENRHDTLPGLLAAIGKAESGRPIPPLRGLQPWPWAINANGAAWYFDSKPAAVAWTRLALARGVQQLDVGCMQINLQSHPAAFRDLDEAFDPTANADYAARFLKLLRADAGGNWYTAVGFYHSRTPDLAADYRERVAA
ncbi:MAG: transglycosylase SLT domain-containing protein, partial [Acetobacteraceae bacterium]|nr:transglycosylase SLT domain-containing protein [Acetobacteraceae bacterium]